MKLLSRKYQLKADVNHVIRCFTDFESVAEAISYFDKEARVRTEVKNGDLYFLTEEPMMRITPFTVNSNGMYIARITPIPELLKRYGGMIVNCSFTTNQSETIVVVTLEAEKTPNLLWRPFVKFIVFVLSLQSRADERKYIQWIEENAENA